LPQILALSISIVMGGTQRLEWTVPEPLLVALVTTIGVVNDSGRLNYSHRQATLTKRLYP